MRVVVIGAGSVGAHVAYRLQEQGAQVVLLDAREPGSGTSSASIAWLSQYPQMSWTEEPGKAALRPRVHDLFREIEHEVPGSYVTWSGTLSWGAPYEREEMLTACAAARARGVTVEAIDAKAARELDPTLRLADDEVVFWEPGAGWVDGQGVVRALVAAFRARGGQVRTGTAVVGMQIAAERMRGVVTAAGEVIEADAVVNASGSWGSHISAMAGLAIPLDLVPGVVVYTAPYPGTDAPTRVINAPQWCGRPDPAGGLAVHWRGEPQRSTHGGNIRTAEEVIAEVAQSIPALQGTAPVRTAIGIRPIPPGGPIVGAVPWLPNLYHCLSHGGIGWAPMWAWAAARELLHGQTIPELSAMRPERFYLETTGLGRNADDAEQVAGVR